MKVIVAGGRDFTDIQLMSLKLKEILGEVNDLEIVSGMAKGADMLAYKLAISNEIKVTSFPANWTDMNEPCVPRSNQYGEYNALAGMNRNKRMGAYADMLIAFSNGSRGTADMIKYMESLNKTIHIIKY